MVTRTCCKHLKCDRLCLMLPILKQIIFKPKILKEFC